MVILVCTTLRTNDLTGSAESTPEPITITATSALPRRFPTQVQSQLAPRSLSLALPESTPTVSTKLLPVKSSEPAKTTKVSAPPKQTPMTSRTTAGMSFDSVPPTVKISTMQIPTYIPASIERTVWLTSDRR